MDGKENATSKKGPLGLRRRLQEGVNNSGWKTADPQTVPLHL